jgi:hypothetical protein
MYLEQYGGADDVWIGKVLYRYSSASIYLSQKIERKGTKKNIAFLYVGCLSSTTSSSSGQLKPTSEVSRDNASSSGMASESN